MDRVRVVCGVGQSAHDGWRSATGKKKTTNNHPRSHVHRTYVETSRFPSTCTSPKGGTNVCEAKGSATAACSSPATSSSSRASSSGRRARAPVVAPPLIPSIRSGLEGRHTGTHAPVLSCPVVVCGVRRVCKRLNPCDAAIGVVRMGMEGLGRHIPIDPEPHAHAALID